MSVVRDFKCAMRSTFADANEVRSVRIATGVNTYFTADLTTEVSEGGPVRSVLSREELQRMAAAQKKRMELPDKPNTHLRFYDKAGTLETRMSGFATSPTISITKTQVSRGLRMVGTDAIIDGLDFSIYNLNAYGVPDVARKELKYILQNSTGKTVSEAVDKGDKSKKGSDFAALLRAVTDTLMKSAEVSFSETLMHAASQREASWRQHEVNQKLIPYWHAILDASDLQFPEIAALCSKFPALIDALTARIIQVIQQPGGFWNVLMGLLGEFRIFYAPGWNGSGKLIKMQDRMVLTAGRPDFEIDATTMDITDGAASLLPLGSVLVMGEIAPGIIPADSYGDVKEGIMARYPTKSSLGFTMKVPAPVWTSCAGSQGALVLLDARSMIVTDPVMLDPNASWQERAAEAERTYKRRTEAITDGFMADYAKTIFEETVWANSRATLKMAVPPGGITPGERRRFRFADGGALTGFVESASFDLTLMGDGGSIGTNISLSHVQYE